MLGVLISMLGLNSPARIQRFERKNFFSNRQLIAAVAIAIILLLVLSSGLSSRVSAYSPTTASSSAGLSCKVGSDPQYDAYDSANHLLYVPNTASNTVTIINQKCDVVKTLHLPAGSDPVSAAFDPANDRVYVTDSGTNNITAIFEEHVSGTINGSGYLNNPWQMAFIPDGNYFVITDFGNDNNITLFFPGTDYIGPNLINVQTSGDPDARPYGVVFSPAMDLFWVSNYNDNNVSVFYATFPLPLEVGYVTGFSTGSNPESMAWDTTDSGLYVVNNGSNNVTIIVYIGLEYEFYTEGNVTVGNSPQGIAFDQTNRDIYVTNTGSGTVSVIPPFSNSVSRTIHLGSTTQPVGIAYGDNGRMYVTDSSTGRVSVVH
jgi:YVTN family beta-propeller protein